MKQHLPLHPDQKITGHGDLRQAYLHTTYRVFEPLLPLRIGEKNPDLEQLLDHHQCRSWAFITAWNPYSKPLSQEDNAQRHAALRERVGSFVCLEGEGAGEDPAWAPERSWLILGISRAEAIQVGRVFEQNAIVYGEKDALPELIDVLPY